MLTQSPMTVAQFEKVAARLGPCELVRGEVQPLSPGGMSHSRLTIHVALALEKWAEKHGVGRVYSNEIGILTEQEPPSVRGADVAYFSYRRLPRGEESEGFTATPPELVVEIVGKGQGWKQMVEKAGEYLRMGVDRVWVIDPKKRRLHVFRPDDEPTVVSGRQIVADRAILPGFRCRLSDFFAR